MEAAANVRLWPLPPYVLRCRLLFIQARELLHETIHSKCRCHVLARLVTQSLAKIRVGDQSMERAHECRPVFHRDQQAGPAVHDDLTGSSSRGRYYRACSTAGFEQCIWQTLATGCLDHDVERSVQRLRIEFRTVQAHTSLQAEFADLILESGSKSPLADQHQPQ